MKKQILLWIAVLFAAGFSNAQTQLSAGDLMFTGFQSGQTGQAVPDRFAFILLKDIAAGTTIFFTDNAVLNQIPVKFCANEGFVSWTAVDPLAAGTVVNLGADSTASSGSVSGGLSFSQSGDQIISYQVNGNDTLCIGGFSSTGWLSTCSSGCGNTLGNNSATCLPAGLQSQVNVMDFSTEQNNSYFSLNPILGTPEEIRALLLNPANWIRSDSLQTWPAWTASVTSAKPDFSGKRLLSVWPNPCTGQLQVEMEEAGMLELFSLQGKSVQQFSLSGGRSSIELSGLENGLYLLRSRNSGLFTRLEICR